MVRCMKTGRSRSHSGESGYVLLAVMLTLTLIMIAMAVEAPRIVQQIKREKEEELVHRGKDYATAVKRFVHKNGGRYPVSVEQLENTNHIRFLRKKYVDPMTGESDWKMVHVGEAQINIPAPKPGLPGAPGTGPGLSSGVSSQPGSNPPGTPPPNQNPGGVPNGQAQVQGGGAGTLGTLTTTGIGNGQTVGGGQIIGVASVSKGHAIKEFNDKDEYDQWYFVYDLRLEQSGGSGITVAAPRGAVTASGAPDSSSSQNPPATSGQPPPEQPPPSGAPTPPPQVPK